MVRLYRSYLVEDGLFLLALLVVGTMIAFNFEVFGEGDASFARTIGIDEAFAIATMVCLGLCWRLYAAKRREVVRRVRAERKAKELAHQDSLTGLPNRRQFDQELKIAISAPPSADGTHAVFLLDLNGFKRINDLYGHAAGDEVLQHVAMRLLSAARPSDLVVRFGGDEFAVLVRQLSGPEQATSIAIRIIEEIETPISVDAVQHHVGVGIGIALFRNNTGDPTEIMRRADVALYRAKAEPKSALRFYDKEMDARLLERDLIERELRSAISTGQVRPFYQPLIDLRSQRVVGFEALARWTHPTIGDISPDRFIPVAEACGMIEDLSLSLFSQATRTAKAWPPNVVLSFNISLLQLKDHSFGLKILRILGESGLPPGRLEIELTESALVEDLEGAQMVLGCLRDAGVRIALDDFGTGYSSLYHLRNFKVDKIKIDRSFITDIGKDPNLVRALIGLSHGLGLIVTAEGVEEPEQAALLLEEGCEQAQGFLYSRAMPEDQTLVLLNHHVTDERSLSRIA